MQFGYLDKQDKDGKVRDGTPQHASHYCENNGGCPYCFNNKMHSTRKRKLNGTDKNNN